MLWGVLVAGCSKRPSSPEKQPVPAGAEVQATPASTATPAAASSDEAKSPAWAADLAPSDRGPRGKWLSIVYVGNGQGEIEPCG
jgi:hypothetical protein